MASAAKGMKAGSSSSSSSSSKSASPDWPNFFVGGNRAGRRRSRLWTGAESDEDVSEDDDDMTGEASVSACGDR